MGTIKFEIDLPEFEKELSLNLTIRRDGEVIYTTSSPSMGSNSLDNNGRLVNSVEKINLGNKISPIVEGSGVSLSNNIMGNKAEEQSAVVSKPSVTPVKRRGGNLMDMTDF